MNDKDMVIYHVFNRTSSIFFEDIDDAKKYLAQYPPSIGLEISRILVFRSSKTTQADSLTLQEKQKLASEQLRYIRLGEIQRDYEIVIQFYNGGVRQIVSRKDTAADVIGKLRYLAEMIKRLATIGSEE